MANATTPTMPVASQPLMSVPMDVDVVPDLLVEAEAATAKLYKE